MFKTILRLFIVLRAVHWQAVYCYNQDLSVAVHRVLDTLDHEMRGYSLERKAIISCSLNVPHGLMQCRPEICKSPHRQPTRTLIEDLFIYRGYNTRTVAPLDDELVELVITPTMLCRFVVVHGTGWFMMLSDMQ